MLVFFFRDCVSSFILQTYTSVKKDLALLGETNPLPEK